MNDEATFFAVCLLLYVFDSIVWLPNHAVAFRVARGKRGRAVFPEDCVASRSGGILWDPIPFVGNVFVTHYWPLALSAEAVYAGLVENPHDARCFACPDWCVTLEDITDVSAREAELIINEGHGLRCSSQTEARSLAELVDGLRGAAKDARSVLVREAIRRRTERAHVRGRLSVFAARTRWPGVACTLQASLLLVGYPVTALAWGFSRFFLEVLLVSTGLSAGIAVLYFLAHRALWPKDLSDRLKTAASMIIAPPFSIRAKHRLAVNLLAGHHPTAVASELLGPTALHEFSRAEWRGLTYPLANPFLEANPVANETFEWFRNELALALTAVCPADRDRDAREPSPEPDSHDSASYCPRCLAQFVSSARLCSDCGCVPLTPL